MKKLTLGDVCKKESSNIAQKDIMECEGEYPIYGAGGFKKNVNFYQQELPYIAVVKDGAGIGRTMLLPAYSSVIGTMQYILPIDYESIDLQYLYYAIVHMDLGKYFSGATIPHIYFKDYKKEKLFLPHGNCFTNRDTMTQPLMRSLPNPAHPKVLFIIILREKMPCLAPFLSFLMKNIRNWKLSWISLLPAMNS